MSALVRSRRAADLLAGMLAVLAMCARPARAQEALPGYWLVGGAVNASVVLGDTLILGGNFNYVGPPSGSCGVIGMSSDVPLEGWPHVDGTVYCSVSDGAGGWYFGGSFLQVGRFARHNLAHVRADFSVDDWNPGADQRVSAMVRNGSTLYIGGDFSSVAGTARSRAAAFDLPSQALTPWSPAVNSSVHAIALDDSLVYLGGSFDHVGGQLLKGIAAVGAGSGAPTAWNPAVQPYSGNDVLGIEVSGNTIYLAGTFTTMGTQPRTNIAAVDATTGLATPWNPSAGATVRGVRVHGARIYAWGDFSSIGGQTRYGLAALDPATGSALAWDPGYCLKVYTFATNGPTIFVGGNFGSAGYLSVARQSIAAIDSVTGNATSWAPGTTFAVYTMGVDGSRVFIGGNFVSLGGKFRVNLAAIDLETKRLLDWAPVTYIGIVTSLAADARALYVGGSFTYVDNVPRNNAVGFDRGILRMNGWNPNANSRVTAMYRGGSQVYLAGLFSTVGGQTRARLASVDPVTGAVSAWNPAPDAPVQGILESGSQIYVAGAFANIGGQTRRGIAALDPTTGLATTWNPGFTIGSYASVLAMKGPDLIVGGYFGGVPRSNLAAIDTATGRFTDWAPRATGVFALYVSGGTVFVGGHFSSVNGEARSNLAAIDATTGELMGWNPVTPNEVISLLCHGQTLFAGYRSDGTDALLTGFEAFPLPEFSLNAVPNGAGTITRNPDLPGYDGAAVVSLTATPAPGWSFLGWQGGATGTANPISVTMLDSVTVQAVFADTTRPAVSVRTPAGGEHFAAGEVATVTWTALDDAGVASVDVLLSRQGMGGPFLSLASGVPNTGSFQWTVTGPPTEAALIRVGAHDPSGNGGDAVGVAAFSILDGLAPVCALALRPPAPNPSSGATSIAFDVPVSSILTLSVFDVGGREVRRLLDGSHPPGRFEVALDTSELSAGLYFVRLRTPGIELRRRLVIVH